MGIEMLFLLSHPLKSTRKKETPHKTSRDGAVGPVSILSAKEPAPYTLQGAPSAASEEPVCAGS